MSEREPEGKKPCQWCEVEGRCDHGQVSLWRTGIEVAGGTISGRIDYRCPCPCHWKEEPEHDA